jgi:hypothetical protein
VRTPVVLLLLALAGMLGGGALIGMWCLGVCLIFCSLVTGVAGFLIFDFPERKPGVHVVPAARSVADVLERARAA